MQIVQISDTHISNAAPQRMQDLENCVKAINALPTPADVVIHTGDISHDGLTEEYQQAKETLNKLDAPYFVMAGNRDKRTELHNVFNDKTMQLPSQGWIQYAVEEYPVRLIMVDTVSVNSNKGQLCTERLAHLEAMLSVDTEKPVALFLHHTPFEAIGIPDPYQYEDWEDVRKLSLLLSQYNNIRGMYCGHVHRFIDGEIANLKASAITCLAGDLRKGEVTDAERKLPVFKSITLL